MAENEWDMLFADRDILDRGVIANPGTINLVQDEFSATDTDTEGQISVAPSVYSLTSSLRGQSLRQVHGRNLNAHSDVYFLPADEEEAHRLRECVFSLVSTGSHRGEPDDLLYGTAFV